MKSCLQRDALIVYNKINQRSLWFFGFISGGSSVSHGSLTPNRRKPKKREPLLGNSECSWLRSRAFGVCGVFLNQLYIFAVLVFIEYYGKSWCRKKGENLKWKVIVLQSAGVKLERNGFKKHRPIISGCTRSPWFGLRGKAVTWHS